MRILKVNISNNYLTDFKGISFNLSNFIKSLPSALITTLITFTMITLTNMFGYTKVIFENKFLRHSEKHFYDSTKFITLQS